MLFFSAAQVLEREQLLNTVASGVSANDLLHQSDFHIRNRYLSRIGAPVSIVISRFDLICTKKFTFKLSKCKIPILIFFS